jgi:serine/threonine protein kinase
MHPTVLGPGALIADRYRVQRELGAGGMGVVVAAEHVTLGQVVAIKLVHPELAQHEEAVARLLQEARAVARLRGEHVARVYDAGQLADGRPFVAMELLRGEDLDHLLHARGRLELGEAVDLVLQACVALAEAHALGIIHRDIKPSNLFLTRRPGGSPCVKVLDFGISKVQRSGTRAGTPKLATRASVIMGTPAYAAPEQLRDARDVDARTDVWALGVVLYQLVTGQHPFDAPSDVETIAKVLSDSPPMPGTIVSGLPEAFDTVIRRCLDRDRDRRPPSIAILTEALLPFAGDEGRRSAATAWIRATPWRSLVATSWSAGARSCRPPPRSRPGRDPAGRFTPVAPWRWVRACSSGRCRGEVTRPGPRPPPGRRSSSRCRSPRRWQRPRRRCRHRRTPAWRPTLACPMLAPP